MESEYFLPSVCLYGILQLFLTACALSRILRASCGAKMCEMRCFLHIKTLRMCHNELCCGAVFVRYLIAFHAYDVTRRIVCAMCIYFVLSCLVLSTKRNNVQTIS